MDYPMRHIVAAAMLTSGSLAFGDVHSGFTEVDDGFGEAGLVQLGLESEQITDLIIDSVDGMYLLSERVVSEPPSERLKLAVTALRSDGTVNGTFGLGGRLDLEEERYEGNSCCLAIDASGRIVVVGNFASTLYVKRYLADGSVDLSFGEAGTARVQFPSSNTSARQNPGDIQIDAAGRIYIVGGGGPGDAFSYIVRLLADGALDPTFVGTTPQAGVRTYSPDSVRLVEFLPGGGLAIVGTKAFPAQLDPLIAHGFLDEAGNGHVSTANRMGPIGDRIYPTAMRATGSDQIVALLERTATSNGEVFWVLASFLGPSSAVLVDAPVETIEGVGAFQFSTFALDSGGKILRVGRIAAGEGPEPWAVARYVGDARLARAALPATPTPTPGSPSNPPNTGGGGGASSPFLLAALLICTYIQRALARTALRAKAS